MTTTNNKLIQQIIEISTAARNGGQSVRIDKMLPSVDVVRGEDDEFFYQEHAATELIDQANPDVAPGRPDALRFQARRV